MHISICVQEILDFLDIKPGQHGLDATLGYGGHTRKMLEKLEGHGHIYGLDVDPIESEKTKKRLRNLGYGEDILTVKLCNFADIDKVAEEMESLTLYWQILVCLLCRSITRNAVLLTNLTDLWIFA